MLKRKALVMSVLCAVASVGCVANVSAEETMSGKLDEVVVEAERGHALYPGSQVARNTSIGILGEQDFMDVPINAISISRNSISNNTYPGDTLSQVLTLDPGVISRGSNTYNDITIRGFNVSPHDFYVDGIAGLMSQSSIPMNFVDRVEIISGPNTLFNGVSTSGSIGGSVNLVPKKATEEPITSIKETFSGKGNLEHAIDVGRRFGKNNEWGIRINADYAKGNTERNNEKMERSNFFVNIDRANDKSKSSLLFGYRLVDQNAPSLPLSLGGHNLPSAPDGKANFQLPWSKYKYNNHILALSHEQNINNNWQWFIKGGYHDEDWNQCMESYYPTLIDDNGNFEASLEDVPIKFWRRSVSTGFKGNVETGAIKHNLVLSADKIWQKGKGADWFPDDVFYGNIYDNSIADSKNKMPTKELGEWYYSGETTLSGLSFIDRLSTQDDRLSFLVGVRQQKVVARSSHNGFYYTKHASKSATSPSFGVMYKFTPQVAAYANYIEGLSKGSFVSSRYANGNQYLDPQETKQYEVGVKWDNHNVATTLSVFQIEQENAYADPATNIYNYYGQQKNKGVQLTVFGKPTPKLNLLGGVMYMNAEQDGGSNDGKDIYGLPKWHATVAAEYEFDESFALTGRFLYSASAFVDSANTRKIPSWNRLDLGARYKTKFAGTGVTIGLNVFNVFDKHYWYSAGNDSVYLGGPRTAVVSAQFDI